MKEQLELQEDDRLRGERFQQFLNSAKQPLRIVSIATPLLVGCMYLLMRNVPKDAFPKDYWLIAVFASMSPFLFLLGIYYPTYRFVRLKCTLRPWGIQFGEPEARIIAWRLLAEWQIEDSRDHPDHFTVGFRAHRQRYFRCITVLSTYSKAEVRAFILPACTHSCVTMREAV